MKSHLLLALAFSLSLAACSQNNFPVNDKPTSAPTKEADNNALNEKASGERNTYLEIAHGLYTPETSLFVPTDYAASDVVSLLPETRCGYQLRLSIEKKGAIELPTDFENICTNEGILTYVPSKYISRQNTLGREGKSGETQEVLLGEDESIIGYNRRGVAVNYQEFKQIRDGLLIEFSMGDDKGIVINVSDLDGKYQFNSRMKDNQKTKSLAYKLDAESVLQIREITVANAVSCNLMVKKGEQITYQDQITEPCFTSQSSLQTKPPVKK